jgi:diguanylate cyclase (GGDEF)-like protein
MTRTLANPVEGDLETRIDRAVPVDLRVLYRRDGEPIRRAAIRQGLWAAVFVYLVFAVTDILLIPDAAPFTIAARFIVGCGTLVLVEMQFRMNVATDRMDLSCASALVLAYLGWLFAAITTNYSQNISYYLVFGAIFMMSANLFFSFRFRLSLAVSGVMLAASLLVPFYLFPRNHNYQLSFGVFYLSCFVFTSYVNWKLNRERYNVFLNALEAKIQHREATEKGKALLRLSRTDPLTGLENRRAVDERLWEYWSGWQQHGLGFVAILIDVDFFKKFNDYYGHQEGDRCLVLVAKALRERIAAYGGSIGRYGGEEFIALAPLSDKDEIADFAEAIRRTVEDLTLVHEHRRDGTSVVTVSLGASFTRDQGAGKLEKVIQEADRALYLAKATGRNCVRLFDPNDPEISDESENIAALLKIAIPQGLVSLVYQPIQEVASERVEAVEALMRLTMLDGTSVPPSLFIPIAERTGAMSELGRWAIRMVCRNLLASNDVRVASVNVSPVQLKAPGFAAAVAAILGETGISGDRLAFEITEGVEMDMHSDVLRCISDLKTLGIRIWLDDFGTGFAGLSWLRLIDFDIVKIDRSFLHDCDGARGRGMLQDIVGLIRNRGPRILVEGVENDEQMAFMRKLGIDYVQGYHVGRPTSARRFRATMARSTAAMLKSA